MGAGGGGGRRYVVGEKIGQGAYRWQAAMVISFRIVLGFRCASTHTLSAVQTPETPRPGGGGAALCAARTLWPSC